jgi:hypothetical protein
MGKIKSSLAAIGQNWAMTQRVYKFLWAEVLGIVLGTIAVIAVPTAIFINWLTALLVALPLGLLAGTFWFSRRAMRAAYARIEGQPGAAAAVIESLRGKWAVTPAVAVSRNEDMVSRVVGKPGVILVSEGAASRVGHMLANEKKKTARWVPDIPIYEIQVGDDEGQIALGKIQKTLSKLPRNLRGSEVTEVRRRLEALGNAQQSMPVPKGPMPTSPRQVRRQRR